MDANLLIEASAGTGKTQALAERLIELLRLGVKPQEIVALTFSRAAAGEIFERFVSLLADRAAEDPSCVALLREVIATQHLSQIGTLDSFLMRIVRSFPLELGLCGDLEMMDEYRAGVELSRTSFSILRRTDRATKKAFVEAFSLAMNRENVRSFAKSYRTFIAAWHEHVLAHPSADAWGVPETIWRDPPAEASATEADVKAAAARVRSAAGADKALGDFSAWVEGFRGSFEGVKGLAKKFLEKDDLFAGATIDVSFNRKALSYGGEQAAAIRAAVRTVCGYVLRLKLELAGGVFTLISVYEAEYAKRVRAAGRLVFADVPRLIAGLPDEVLKNAREKLTELEEEGDRKDAEKAKKSKSRKAEHHEDLPGSVKAVIDALRNTDPNDLSPKEALTLLFSLKSIVSGKSSDDELSFI